MSNKRQTFPVYSGGRSPPDHISTAYLPPGLKQSIGVGCVNDYVVIKSFLSFVSPGVPTLANHSVTGKGLFSCILQIIWGFWIGLQLR